MEAVINMSLETWKAEFYPVSAHEAIGSELEAAEHSLRKWQGRAEPNLEKHGMQVSGCQDIAAIGEDATAEKFSFLAATCALCAYAAEREIAEPALPVLISEDEIRAANPGTDIDELLDHSACLHCPLTREFKRSCWKEYQAASRAAGQSMRILLEIS